MDRDAKPLTGVAGILVRLLLTAVFLALGALIGYIGLGEYGKAEVEAETSGWVETDAEVLGVGVERVSGKGSFRFKPWVRYSYSWPLESVAAELRESVQVRLGEWVLEDYTSAFLEVKDFVPGGRIRAFVNPEDPGQAVLRHKLVSSQRGLWAFALMEAHLALILFLMWKPSRPTPESVSGRFWGGLLCCVMVGLGGWWGWEVWEPVSAYVGSGLRWSEVSCTVLDSHVGQRTWWDQNSRQKADYAPEVFYEYALNGRKYRSTRLSFSESRTGSFQKAERKQQGFPPGAVTVCHVNPERPWEAVLERNLGVVVLGLFPPLLFLVAGIFFLWCVMAGKRRWTEMDDAIRRMRGG